MPKKKYAKSLAELARHIGVTPSSAGHWPDKAWFPGHVPGKGYDIEQVRSCWEQYERDRKQGGSGSPGGQPKDARELKTLAEIRKIKQDTRWKRLKNESFEGNLIPADDVFQFEAATAIKISELLDMLPQEVQMLVPAEVRPQVLERVTNYVFEFKTMLSNLKYDPKRGTVE